MPVPVLSGILGFASVFIIIFFGNQDRAALSDVLKLCVLAVVLLTIVIFYLLSQQGKVKELPYFNFIFIGTYIGSFILIMVTKGRAELALWMSGGLIIAMLFNMYLGNMVIFNFIFFAGFVGKLDMESIVYLLIMGTVMCLLSNDMKRINTLGYTVVIILSIQIVLLFTINNFILKNSLNLAAVYSVLSSLTAIGFSYGIYSFYYKMAKIKMDNQFFDQLEQNLEYHSNSRPIKAPGRDEILDLEFPLIQRLKNYSMKVYKHSLLIGEQSGKAAKAVGADEYKAKAGGLYHEIGRIQNKQYVEEGVKLSKVYQLPGFIADIICQHNLKYGKPKSPEAAIVMLTISVMATKEYLEKYEKKVFGNLDAAGSVPIEKMVEKVFQMRLAKGSLDESGLTLKQYNKLKELFLHM